MTALPTPPLEMDDAAFDAYLFGRILALVLTDPARPPTHALGLTGAELRRLCERHVPAALSALGAPPVDADSGEDALEEADLRAFILEFRGKGREEEVWLAHILARRGLEPNHLWQDLGLASRGDLSALFRRHFPALAALNHADMKWKKFFYRQLCQREGVMICKSPNCEICDDFAHCFGEEDGAPLGG